MHRSHIREYMEQNRMTSLMECGNAFFFLGNNTAAFLSTDSNFDKCTLDIFLLDKCTIFFCSKDG